MIYDTWKTTNPADNLCDFCDLEGRPPRGFICENPKCRYYRDPDDERDQRRDNKMWDDQ